MFLTRIFIDKSNTLEISTFVVKNVLKNGTLLIRTQLETRDDHTKVEIRGKKQNSSEIVGKRFEEISASQISRVQKYSSL